jgi:hypothetical protein
MWMTGSCRLLLPPPTIMEEDGLHITGSGKDHSSKSGKWFLLNVYHLCITEDQKIQSKKKIEIPARC